MVCQGFIPNLLITHYSNTSVITQWLVQFIPYSIHIYKLTIQAIKFTAVLRHYMKAFPSIIIANMKAFPSIIIANMKAFPSIIIANMKAFTFINYILISSHCTSYFTVEHLYPQYRL